MEGVIGGVIGGGRDKGWTQEGHGNGVYGGARKERSRRRWKEGTAEGGWRRIGDGGGTGREENSRRRVERWGAGVGGGRTGQLLCSMLLCSIMV